MARSLFISYDGLTDTLGQSQILPYLVGLSGKGHTIHILSCEKKVKFEANRHLIESICSSSKIHWTPIPFHADPPVIAKYYDLYKLYQTAFRLHRKHSFDLIHCRSYLSADVGRRLKSKTGVKYLFDMRGFWVDERVDGGLWNTSYYFYRRAYRHWKRKEAQLIAEADHIVSLTEAAKKEIGHWPSYAGKPLTIIPCSVDMNLFTYRQEEEVMKAKEKLQLPADAFVLSYLGSLGTWYLMKEMIFLFSLIKEIYDNAKFLILTPDNPAEIYSCGATFGLRECDFVVRFSPRMEVPVLMKASDVSVSFIKPSYSKIASSPTKLGELLAMGIPVICNSIGDVNKIIENTGGGIVVDGFDKSSLQPAIDFVKSLDNFTPIDRERVAAYYSLKGAVEKYDEIYKKLSRTETLLPA